MCTCCNTWSCPQWPDRCCLCLTKRIGVILTGLVSIVANLAVVIPCVYALVNPLFWNEAYLSVEDWIVTNHWDSDVTSSALHLISSVSAHHAIVLIGVIAYCSLHAFNALLLIIGALCEKRLLMIPWMMQDAVSILTISLVFIFWAFFSFFIHVLLAVFFPVIAGLILGFWIYMWRNVRTYFVSLGVDDSQHQGTMYRKLPAGSGTRSLLAP